MYIDIPNTCTHAHIIWWYINVYIPVIYLNAHTHTSPGPWAWARTHVRRMYVRICMERCIMYNIHVFACIRTQHIKMYTWQMETHIEHIITHVNVLHHRVWFYLYLVPISYFNIDSIVPLTQFQYFSSGLGPVRFLTWPLKSDVKR